MAIAHGDENIRVQCLCPQAVETAMNSGAGRQNPAISDGVLTPAQVRVCLFLFVPQLFGGVKVADAVSDAIDKETFLILPHQKVAQYVARKAQDYDKWLVGMRKWRRSML